MGKYFVTPTSLKADNGRFQASFALQRTQQKSSYCRVFRFDKTFATTEAAYLYAVTQGWLQACMATPSSH
ncbi:MAG: hypothetical protein ACN6NT_03215 [Comamonas sp.]